MTNQVQGADGIPSMACSWAVQGPGVRLQGGMTDEVQGADVIPSVACSGRCARLLAASQTALLWWLVLLCLTPRARRQCTHRWLQSLAGHHMLGRATRGALRPWAFLPSIS